MLESKREARMTAILSAIARRLHHAPPADDTMTAFARQAAADYEAMLGLDRTIEERRSDLARLMDKSPVLDRTRRAG